MTSLPEIPCRICGNPTKMHGTKLCDRCWELEFRIKRDPKLARQILDSIPGIDADLPTAEDVRGILKP